MIAGTSKFVDSVNPVVDSANLVFHFKAVSSYLKVGLGSSSLARYAPQLLSVSLAALFVLFLSVHVTVIIDDIINIYLHSNTEATMK